MEYAAKHYVKITGQKFMPGEIIDIPIPEDKLPRLLKIGAVIPLAPTTPNACDSQLEDVNGDSSGDSKDTPDEAEIVEETGEDAEVPEIDVMDGIVAKGAEDAPAKTTAKKPARNSRTKGK